MRFKLQLHINKQRYGDILPFNYQYECSALIYKIMARSDAAFAAWLHDNGYQSERKQFKLFTYSRLHIPQYKVVGNNMQILSDTIEWYISFLPEISTRQFVQGIFSEQTFELGNKF
ncbi:MAG: CRISPR-associated endoribonuclease, partial [Bacteroidetes bacterium]|nr:CRISPR-associated endoribonuclease [Bacteroidota bacterium]